MRLTRFFALQAILLVLCVSAHGHGPRVDGMARMRSIFADEELLLGGAEGKIPATIKAGYNFIDVDHGRPLCS